MTPVIYLHGFASGPSSSKARHFAERLTAAGYSIEVPDLAAGDFEHLTISRQLAVLEKLAAGRAISLIGSSMGGYLSALYADRHPEVERLVLLAPAFGFARRWPETLGPEAVAQWRSSGTTQVFHYARNCHVPLHYGLLEDAARYPDYPEFQQPTLIFHGVHDDVVPVDFSRLFAASHANVSLRIVDSGHELINVLETITPEVESFLRTPASLG